MNIDLPELVAMTERIGAIFERHGLRYHLTGGVVSSHYGEMRNTQDVDIVVDMAACKDRQSLFLALKKEFYVDQGAFNDAICRKTLFQVLDMNTMLKADIYTASLYTASLLPDRFDRIVSGDSRWCGTTDFFSRGRDFVEAPLDQARQRTLPQGHCRDATGPGESRQRIPRGDRRTTRLQADP